MERDRLHTSKQRRLYALTGECTVCGWLRVYFGVGTKHQRVGFGGGLTVLIDISWSCLWEWAAWVTLSYITCLLQPVPAE